MTKDDIIRMAREAWGPSHEVFWFDDDGIARFAALVAEAEAAKWAAGAKISIPTEAMEQQFSVYHRRGYEAGKALIPAAIEAERKRADALAATVAALRDVVTTDAETKEEFVSRVRAVLGEDPDARVLGAVLAERKACGTIKADKPPRRYKGSFQSIFEDGVKWGAASVRAKIRALK